MTAVTVTTHIESESNANLSGIFKPYFADRNYDNRLTEQQIFDLAFAGIAINKGGSSADRRKRVRQLRRVARTLRLRYGIALAIVGQLTS